MRNSLDGDLLFFHGFKQSRLGFWRCTVDFVCEKDVREKRACAQFEFTGLLVVHVRPHDVRRQQVGSELNALELTAKGSSKGVGEQRLCQPWEILQQHVPVGEDTDRYTSEVFVLADDNLRDLVHEAVRNGRNRSNQVLCSCATSACLHACFHGTNSL